MKAALILLVGIIVVANAAPKSPKALTKEMVDFVNRQETTWKVRKI